MILFSFHLKKKKSIDFLLLINDSYFVNVGIIDDKITVKTVL